MSIQPRVEPEPPSMARHRALLDLAALDKHDFDAVMRQILRTDADALGVERVNAWCFEAAPRAIRCVAGYVRGRDAFESGVVLRERDYPAYFRALSDDPIVLADDARTDPRTAEFRDGYLVPLGITSMMDVPIWVGGRLWGVVCHEHVGPRRAWTEAERDFAMSIGHIVSMTIEARDRLAAERAARSSELFVGVLSHDLRNPLSTIRASTELLRGHVADDADVRAVSRILRSTEQMNRMIDQLLDFTRIRMGGGLPVERTPTDLGELCERVASDATVADGGRIHVHAVGNPVGTWDPDRLWQLVSNLIGNALTHGAPGEPIDVRIDGAAGDAVAMVVESHGEIAPELREFVFDPFRGHDARESGDRGLGLGLYIARETAVAHGGTIDVVSGEGVTRFTVVLPRW